MPDANTLIGGRYRLESVLGSGGSGRVWRAWDEQLQRAVAVKEVIFPGAVTPEERERIASRALKEARNAARLDHPNVVTTHDVLAVDGRPWIVMRLVEGRSLERLVAEDGPMSPQAAARIGLHLLDAIETAHRAGVLHRDIKPSNVMITENGTALLADFSIATAIGSGTVTSTGILLGSPGYIAPERLESGEVGPPSDMFGLGATLYYAVEGERPFEQTGESLSVLFATANRPHRRPLLADSLEPVLDGLLEKDPARRLDAAQTRAALRDAAAGINTVPLMTPQVPEVQIGQTLALRREEPEEEPRRSIFIRIKLAFKWSIGVSPSGWRWYRPALGTTLLLLLIVITQLPPSPGEPIPLPAPNTTISPFASAHPTPEPSAVTVAEVQQSTAPAVTVPKKPQQSQAAPPPPASQPSPALSPMPQAPIITSAVLSVRERHFQGTCDSGTSVTVFYTMTITSSEPKTNAHITVIFGNGNTADGDEQTDLQSRWSGTFSYVYPVSGDATWNMRFRASNAAGTRTSNTVQISVDCTNF